jgi:hypothetical protein
MHGCQIGPNVLFCVPNKTMCILLVSVMLSCWMWCQIGDLAHKKDRQSRSLPKCMSMNPNPHTCMGLYQRNHSFLVWMKYFFFEPKKFERFLLRNLLFLAKPAAAVVAALQLAVVRTKGLCKCSAHSLAEHRRINPFFGSQVRAAILTASQCATYDEVRLDRYGIALLGREISQQGLWVGRLLVTKVMQMLPLLCMFHVAHFLFV